MISDGLSFKFVTFAISWCEIRQPLCAAFLGFLFFLQSSLP